MSDRPHLNAIAARFLSRRDFLRGTAAATAMAAMPLGALTAARAESAAPALTFPELERVGKDELSHRVAEGYSADVLISWGDAVLPHAPRFDPMNQTAAAQARQFGYNCDFVGYVPLHDGATSVAQHLASGDSSHGILGVNHEYVSPRLMMPGFEDPKQRLDKTTAEIVATEQAALGHSFIEIRRGSEGWQVVPDSPYARRFHVGTPFAIVGPARGHARMKTEGDPTGTLVLGTHSNCAGGVTPWGTILSGEENIQNYFGGLFADMAPEYAREAASAQSFEASSRAVWGKFDKRFDIAATPHEFNRYGWIVEMNPYDSSSTPKKLTALGRFKHEGATIVATPGRRVVAYMGDDQPFEHVYKFVSNKAYVDGNPEANADALHEGTLYVARFHEDGTGTWLPLVFGEGPLTALNGFDDQGDVLIDARRAAKLLGATETDRPEDVETDPVTSRTYVAFTGGTDRKETGPAAPRAPNARGHIVEILAPGTDGNRDHAATHFTWDILVLGGHAGAETPSKGQYGEGTTEAGYFAMPDNLAFDPLGRLWIATDGADKIGLADGIWACCITGPQRAVTRHFFSVPLGAEQCGPCFTPDGTTLFVAIQHPGDTDGSTFANPSTRWPAGPDSAMPPRPSVMAITRKGGGLIGS